MIITLKDGSTKEYSEPKSIIEIAAAISEGLARMASAGEVTGEVEEERHDARRPLGIGRERNAEHVIRGKVDGKHLQHERRAAHDRDIDARNPAKRRDFAHAHKRHGDSQWNRPQQCQHKQLQTDQESLAKHLHHDLNRQPKLSFTVTEQQVLIEIGTVPKIASDKPAAAYFGTRGGLEPQGWVLWLFQNPVVEGQTVA